MTSRMRLSMMRRMGPQAIWREPTMGSIASSILGMRSKANHSLLLGGGLMRMTPCPSRRLSSTARSRLTSRALNRAPRFMVAFVAIS